VLFAALAVNSLAINLEKCVFTVPILDILGHTILAAGSAPIARHTAAIDTCLPPPGHQATATFSQHGKFLPPFPPRLRPCFAAFN
jgi:hypothetical protein